jgi:hypothetical protein
LPTRSFPIEAGQVLQFARAIGDENPVYTDESSPQARALGGVIAPPTFTMVADHFDPAYERRPRVGEPWFGSGRERISDAAGSQQPQAGASGFHAEQHFVYHRHPVAGERLYVTRRDGRSWEGQGRRGGRLCFRERVSEFRDAQGHPVITARWVSVTTEHRVGGAG